MSNYCGIGIDAELSLDFHQAREEEPGKFTSRSGCTGGSGLPGTSRGLTSCDGGWGPSCRGVPTRFHNKGVYVRVGLQKISHPRGLHRALRLQVEQREVELPSIEGLIFINIPRCPRGPCPPTQPPSDLRDPTHGAAAPALLSSPAGPHVG